MVLVLGGAMLGATLAGAAQDAAPRLDLNRASAQELETLPQIGPALAQRIVEFRTKQGPFKSVEDLLKVQGVGEKVLTRVRERLTVGGPKP
jgi:competence protein ComEA